MQITVQSLKLLPVLYKFWYTPIEVVVTDPTAMCNKNDIPLMNFEHDLTLIKKAYKSVKFFSSASPVGKLPLN